MNFVNVAIVTVIFISYLTIADAGANTIPVTYLSYVDNVYGFYRVIDITTHKSSPYDNRTLIINGGDTVTWMNDADNAILTIVSEQQLFTNKRLDIRQRSSYTFDQIGTYTFHIKEYLNRQHLTVIVNAIEEDTYTPMPTTPTTPVSITSTPTIPMPTISIPTTPIPDPVPSMTQILSIIVAILSISIIYKIGKY